MSLVLYPVPAIVADCIESMGIFPDSDSEPELPPKRTKRFDPPSHVLEVDACTSGCVSVEGRNSRCTKLGDGHECANKTGLDVEGKEDSRVNGTAGVHRINPTSGRRGADGSDLSNLDKLNAVDDLAFDYGGEFDDRVSDRAFGDKTAQKNSLSRSILDESSVGLKMMRKMGFQPGARLGASGNPSALAEPIVVARVKLRAGIGAQKNASVALQAFSDASAARYWEASCSSLTRRHERATIAKLQRFCYGASGDDARAPEEAHVLWRDYAERIHDKDAAAVDYGEQTDKLAQLLTHARTHFHYCPYCGVQYDNAHDMASFCPGPSFDLHPL